MAATHALDVLDDPLVTPLLAFLKDAVNADLADLMEAQALVDIDATDAIKSTAPRPLDLRVEGDGSLPMLGCYRTITRTKQVTMAHKDSFATLEFNYVSPCTGVESLNARWPLLQQVWESMISALTVGSHPAHRDGVDVISELGITWVNFDTATKRELFAERGDFAFPAFIGSVEVRKRMERTDTMTTYPALSFLTKLYEGTAPVGGSRQPDAQALDYTPIGAEEVDSQYADDEQELSA